MVSMGALKKLTAPARAWVTAPAVAAHALLAPELLGATSAHAVVEKQTQ